MTNRFKKTSPALESQPLNSTTIQAPCLQPYYEAHYHSTKKIIPDIRLLPKIFPPPPPPPPNHHFLTRILDYFLPSSLKHDDNNSNIKELDEKSKEELDFIDNILG